MKYTIFYMASISLIFAFSNNAIAESTPYPVTHDSKIAKSLSNHDGEIVSLELKLTEIREGPKNKPYIKAIFPNGNDFIWLAPVVNISNSLQKGDIVRVLGYVAKINDDTLSKVSSYNNTGYHLLSICYYNFRTKKGLFFPFKAELNQCSKWRDGNVN